ncbi:hypothetical protein BVC80_5665g1 [Macleaya cordata]|uniref:Uncharacterized protein n=1 Tax=Macleaya cordata TaxID=56857 RepID=A0A200QM72_MACCD|nr:hypothetical protein BVC80_5665g1 [Macleaya cordata]
MFEAEDLLLTCASSSQVHSVVEESEDHRSSPVIEEEGLTLRGGFGWVKGGLIELKGLLNVNNKQQKKKKKKKTWKGAIATMGMELIADGKLVADFNGRNLGFVLLLIPTKNSDESARIGLITTESPSQRNSRFNKAIRIWWANLDYESFSNAESRKSSEDFVLIFHIYSPSVKEILHNGEDFGVDPSTEASSDAQGKASVSGGPSRFGRFSSQLLQKTMGWVSRSRPDRQAKLGEKNKFYYDEKLKQWIEEGAEPPAQERALPPPPTTAFQNGTPDYNIKNTLKSESLPANGGSEFRSPSPSEHSSGIPPIPPSSNHFSARGRMGVRSRYVDTFNKSGGAPTNLFQTPSVLAAKPATGTNAKFFIPTPATSGDQTVDNATEENIQEATGSPNEGPPISSTAQNSIFSTPSLSSSMQRAPSMNSITPMGSKGMGVMGNGALSSGSRRTASWSGSVIDTFNSPSILSGTMRNPHSSFMHVDSMGPPTRGSSFGELHEVEL